MNSTNPLREGSLNVDFIDQLATQIFVSDINGYIVKINIAASPLFGHWKGQNLFRMLPFSISVPECCSWEKGQIIRQRLKMSSREGRHYFDTECKAMFDQADQHCGFLVELHDVTEYVQQENSLSQALDAKELLFQEVHHRVKNNLQVISSTLSLLGRQLEPGSTQDSLADVSRMVESIALVHEALQESNVVARSIFPDYLSALSQKIVAAYCPRPENIHLDFQVGKVEIPPAQAHYLAMIVNELLSNVFKHAFADRETGSVALVGEPHPDEGIYTLEVSNDGKAFPPDFDPFQGNSFGMRLVRMMLAQLDGELRVSARNLNAVTLHWPMYGRRGA